MDGYTDRPTAYDSNSVLCNICASRGKNASWARTSAVEKAARCCIFLRNILRTNSHHMLVKCQVWNEYVCCIYILCWNFLFHVLTLSDLEQCLESVYCDCAVSLDMEYLRTILPPSTEEEFYDYLSSISTDSVVVYAVDEGMVVFPKVPLMRIEGPLAVVQLLETTLLNLVNYARFVQWSVTSLNKAYCEPGHSLVMKDYWTLGAIMLLLLVISQSVNQFICKKQAASETTVHRAGHPLSSEST